MFINSRICAIVFFFLVWLVLLAPAINAEQNNAPDAPTGNTDGTQQQNDKPDPNRFEPLVIPIIGGNTDIGALLGATAAVAKMQSGHYPYRWKGNFTAATSFKKGPDEVELPVNYYAVTFDIPGLADNSLRLSPRGEFKRIANAGYYGLGNTSTVGDEPDNFRRNQYKILAAKARLNFLISLTHGFYIATGASFRYVSVEPYEDSQLAEDAEAEDKDGDPLIHGTFQHVLTGVKLGLVFDNRDHEANPTKGMIHELSFWGWPGPSTGGDYSFGAALLQARFFIPLIDEYLVLALRARGDTYFGTVPFHYLDLGMIRGVPARRYHGQIKILGNIELRSIFYRFSAFKQDFGLGAAAFLDSGRVWADYSKNQELDGEGLGLKWGVGGGIRFQWGETRIARFDIAYSPDKTAKNSDLPIGIYMHIGHFF